MIVLIVQKDTLEAGKVKAVLKIITESPESFLEKLQEAHCYVCQLLAYTNNSPYLFDKLIQLVGSCKTNLGKDWYEFDHDTLAKIISLFMESDKTFVDFPTIKNIFGFSLNMFPVIFKEVRITENPSLPIPKEIRQREEILALIGDLTPTDLPKRRSKHDKKEEKKEEKVEKGEKKESEKKEHDKKDHDKKEHEKENKKSSCVKKE